MTPFDKWVLDQFDNWQSLASYAFIAVLSIFSATVGHFHRRNEQSSERRTPFTWTMFWFDQAASLLAAILVFWVTLNSHVPPLMTAVAIALTAFWGVHSLIVGLRILKRRFNRMADPFPEEPPAQVYENRRQPVKKPFE